MPQNGFHGLVGLAAGKLMAKVSPAEMAVPVVAGVTLGAMLPDVDMYPTAIAFLAGRKDLVYEIHRTATHSLLAILLAVVIGLAWRGRAEVRWWWLAFGVGVTTHALLDYFLWFAQLDFWWPFSHLPVGSPLAGIPDFWRGIILPPIAGNADGLVNLRDAFEFPAMGLYLLALKKLAPSEEGREKRIFGLAVGACWVFFAISLLGVVLWKAKWQSILVMTPALLFLLPFCWIETVRRAGRLGEWARK